jgi:hypothetical protein
MDGSGTFADATGLSARQIRAEIAIRKALIGVPPEIR